MQNDMEKNRFWACELAVNGSELVPTASISMVYAKPVWAPY